MSVQEFTTQIEIHEIPNHLGYGISLSGCQASVWTRWERKPHVLTETWRPVAVHLDRSGHLDVKIRSNGRAYRTGVHRLVLLTFVGKCPEGCEACHENDRKCDNRVKNLRWDTDLGNMRDREKNGISTRGVRNGNAKLTERDVRRIRELLLQGGLTQTEIAEQFGVHQMQISYIHTGKTWKHVI